MKLVLEDAEDDDPILSLVNLIDVFLVIIAALMLAFAKNPFNPFAGETATLIRNAGKADMEVVTRKGSKIERYRNQGSLGEGNGVRAGIAYRMADGSIVYVPDDSPGQTQ